MNPEIKTLWLEALRGGEYTQGSAYLRRRQDWAEEFSYCCLGVLCDLAEKSGVVSGEVRVEPWDAEVTYYGDDAAMNMLPLVVVEWAGLSNNSGQLSRAVPVNDRGLAYDTLWELNDSGNLSFDEIADVIEEQL